MDKDNYADLGEPGVPDGEGESWEQAADRLDLGSRERIADLMSGREGGDEQTGNKPDGPDTES